VSGGQDLTMASGDALYERARRSHIPALDGLRGIAVLTVMWLHFVFLIPRTGGERLFWHLSETGWIGVDLFFVLSGFLITGILYDAKGGPHYFRNFYMRRSLRIFPLYYAFLILIFAVIPLLRSSADHVGKQVWMWTYLSNVLFARVGWEGMPAHTTHLWSLAIEEQFYLLWPLLVWLANGRRLIQLCVGSIVVAFATRLVLHFVFANDVAAYALMPARIDALAAGGLLAVLVRDREGARLAARYLNPVAAGSALVLILVMVWTGPIQGTGMLPTLAVPVLAFGYTALALFFAAMLGKAVAAPTGQLSNRVLTSRVLVAFGKYSYALYLLHILVRDILQNQILANRGGFPVIGGSQIPAQLVVVAFGIGVSYAVAFASWHLFEKRILALKRFFPYERQTAARPQPAAEPPVSIAPGADLGTLSAGVPPRVTPAALIEEGSTGR
jgi:peptidoglycan/LPS O-acetylase OafA/YrhL